MRNKCIKLCVDDYPRYHGRVAREGHSRAWVSLHSLRRWPEDKNGMISPNANPLDILNDYILCAT